MHLWNFPLKEFNGWAKVLTSDSYSVKSVGLM